MYLGTPLGSSPTRSRALAMVEHRSAVDAYILLCSKPGDDASCTAETPAGVGTVMTSHGPAPYAGNILDNPDLVWMDDVWTAEEVDEAKRTVAKKSAPVSQFWKTKYTRESRKSWDKFYKRNGRNFFKDRHYLGNVFPELAETEQDVALAKTLEATPGGVAGKRAGRRTLLELGCGVGNAVFPLLEDNQGLYVIAVDLSAKGIEVLRQHPMYSCGRCVALVLDASSDELPPSVFEGGGVDMVLLQFAISAVAVEDMGRVARLAEQALKPGGLLFVRDYGRYDEAQLRFAKGKCLGENIYVRQDGTTSYFFSLVDLRQLFCGGTFTPHHETQSSSDNRAPDTAESTESIGCGSSTTSTSKTSGSVFGQGASLIEEELSFVRRQYANRGQRVARRRVWVHAKFRKPLL